MQRFLVLVTSQEALELGAQLAHRLRELRHGVAFGRLRGSSPPPTDYTAVIIGDSWWSRWHSPAAATYVRANRDALASRPTGYFAIHGMREYAELPPDEDQFFGSVRWRPTRTLGIAFDLPRRVAMSVERRFGVAARGPGVGRSLHRFADELSALARR